MNPLKRIFKPSRKSYSELKAANRELISQEEKERISHPEGLPTYINIETTRECNLRCRMCPFHRSAETRKRWRAVDAFMPQEMFMAIAEELFPTLDTAGMTVTGEFTVTPYLDAVFDTMEKYEVKLDAFTNAAKLDQHTARRMVELASCLTVSHDSVTPEQYDDIRRSSSFDEVLKNIELIFSEREKLKEENRPRLDLQTVLMKSNVNELPEIVSFAKKQGFDMVKGIHIVIFDRDLKDESLLYHRELYNNRLKEALGEAKKVGIEALFPPEFPMAGEGGELRLAQIDPPQKGCLFLWQRSFINFDGEVMPCCAVAPPKVGNINKGLSFRDVWRGDKYAALRRSIDTDDPHPSCKRCWMREPSIRPGTEEEYILFDK